MTANPRADPLQRIQQRIVAEQFAEALTELETLLLEEPDHADALYMAAVCQRYLARADDAMATLERLKSLVPDHGRAHQEQGHLLRSLQQEDRALAAYARAVRINPALEASWRGQMEILLSQGQRAQALQVREQLERLLATPRSLVAVMDLIAQGKLGRAEELCREVLRKVPHHVEAMRLLAEIGVRMGVLEDAEFLLESAAEFEPDNIQVRIDYIGALRKRQKFARARDEAARLLARDPGNPRFQSLYAIECMQTGDYDTALACFDDVLAALPDDPITLTSRGHALKTRGDTGKAIHSYRRALAHHPGHGEAYYSLANLKTYSFTDAEVEQMQRQESSSDLSHMDRVYLAFALGKAHEDAGEFDRAFRHYATGNLLKKAQSRYKAERMHEEFAAQQEVCTTDLFASPPGTGCDAPDPIFIVGMPRAGSTLLEQILSSHPAVDGTLELPNILSLSHRLRRHPRQAGEPAYPAVLSELTAAELARFGEEFIHDTRIHRAGAPRFIDKMPNNFRHIGLIKLILPNAKIIDARRHPMACCFSCYKQLFAEGQEFTYSLTDVGRYYRDYVALMDHWDAVLPGAVLRVQYEEVVGDLEGQVRRMLDFLELPFDQSCLRYYETERSVRTPSSEQVRQPIYESGVDQWRHFAAHLDELTEALGPLLERYPVVA